MARGKAVGRGSAAAPVAGVALGWVCRAELCNGLREGLRSGLKRLGGTERGVFREVRLAGAPSEVGGTGTAGSPSPYPKNRGVALVEADGSLMVARFEFLDAVDEVLNDVFEVADPAIEFGIGEFNTGSQLLEVGTGFHDKGVEFGFHRIEAGFD